MEKQRILELLELAKELGLEPFLSQNPAEFGSDEEDFSGVGSRHASGEGGNSLNVSHLT